MSLILGQLVHFKQTNRENGIKYGFVDSFNGEKVNLTLFNLGTVTYKTNVVVVDSQEVAEVGQCWVSKLPQATEAK